MRSLGLFLLGSLLGCVAGMFVMKAVEAHFFTRLPIKAYRTDKEHFEKYVRDVRSGAIAKRADDSGFTVDDELSRLGVSHVYDENSYIVFVFEGMPTDSTEELIWSPSGIDALRPLKRSRIREVILLERLGDPWYYCAED